MKKKKWFVRFLKEVLAHIVSIGIVSELAYLTGPIWRPLLAWIEVEIRISRAELLGCVAGCGLLGLIAGATCVAALPLRRPKTQSNPSQISELTPEQMLNALQSGQPMVGLWVRWVAEYRDTNPTDYADEVRLTLITCDASQICVLAKLSSYPGIELLSSGTFLEVTGRIAVAGDPTHLDQVRLHIYRNSRKRGTKARREAGHRQPGTTRP